ncbi:MAG: hypothetical protein ACREV8_13685 [Gammaproteobacteria bacterium]
MIEVLIGVAAVAIGLAFLFWSARFFQTGKRHATNALWFLGRWSPPQNDPRPKSNRDQRRRSGSGPQGL